MTFHIHVFNKGAIVALFTLTMGSFCQGADAVLGDVTTPTVGKHPKKPQRFHALNAGSGTFEFNASGNPKGLHAGLFFGASSLGLNHGNSPIEITQMLKFRGVSNDVVYVPNGVKATVEPDAALSNMNLDAGLYLGYFPEMLTFDIGNDQKLAFGGMTKLGFGFLRGFGAWLGAGPEVAYRKGSLSVNAGYLFSFTSMDRSLGTLKLEGADHIVVDASGLNSSDWESESIFWRRHDQQSTLKVVGSAVSQCPYIRLGYHFGSEDDGAGIGIVIGYRNATNAPATYELHGKYEKLNKEHISELKGPEFNNLGNAFDFGGLFFQLELFSATF
jgi:hypothetical protein